MDRQEIKEWLGKTGKDRHWLAEQIGATKGTLDQWFYRGFPEWAQKSIELLMNPPAAKSELELVFTDKEFDLITKAVSVAGYSTRRDFYKDAILEKAESYAEQEPTEKEPDISRRKAG